MEIPKNPFYHPDVIGFILALWELPELGEDGTYPLYHGDSQIPFILIK